MRTRSKLKLVKTKKEKSNNKHNKRVNTRIIKKYLTGGRAGRKSGLIKQKKVDQTITCVVTKETKIYGLGMKEIGKSRKNVDRTRRKANSKAAGKVLSTNRTKNAEENRPKSSSLKGVKSLSRSKKSSTYAKAACRYAIAGSMLQRRTSELEKHS